MIIPELRRDEMMLDNVKMITLINTFSDYIHKTLSRRNFVRKKKYVYFEGKCGALKLNSSDSDGVFRGSNWKCFEFEHI